MSVGGLSPGFRGRPRPLSPDLPPGQYLEDDFPVLSAGPTPDVDVSSWELGVEDGSGRRRSWDWAAFSRLPSEDVVVDIHCVTRWSKTSTRWRGVSLDLLLEATDAEDAFALVRSYGGYTTSLLGSDLVGRRAWAVFAYDGDELDPIHGGPVRLLVPHLYFYKSAKWLRDVRLSDSPQTGFWEANGYHENGDPWLEQRYWGD